MYDLVIRSGTVVDGTGGPARVADVAVSGGRVEDVGTVGPDRAAREVDATDRIVCPGFVDLHTHYDIQAFWDPGLSPSPQHGITTVIGGNCGFSVAPIGPRAEDAEYLLAMLARVEGMPAGALAAACDWGWRSFDDYLDRIEAGGLGPNAGFLVGHSALRRAVMGRDAVQRVATADEVDAMVSLLGESLAAGGLGFSSSLAATHNDGTGGPVPSRFAATDELVSLAGEVNRHPGTTLEFIPGVGAFTAVEADLMGALSAAADRPLNWNVLIVMAGLEDQIRSQLGASDRAAAMGGRVLGLTMPAPVMPRLSFASGFLLDTIPGWHDVMTGPLAQRRAALASAAERTRLLAAAADGGAAFGLADFGQYVLTDVHSDTYRHLEGRTVADAAAELGLDAFDAACEIALADDLTTGFLFPPAGDRQADWEARVEVWRDERSVIGASDAGAHLDFLATFNYPTVMLRRAVVDLGLLDWPEAISLLTGRPAALYGLRDRGRITPGAHADLVVLDPDRLAPEPITTRVDLPDGGWRLFGGASGYDHVIVGGVDIVTHDEPTGALPGKVLRSGRVTTTLTASGEPT